MEACYLLGKYLGAQAEINLVEALAAGDLSQAVSRQTTWSGSLS
jgi:hypothetical protein